MIKGSIQLVLITSCIAFLAGCFDTRFFTHGAHEYGRIKKREIGALRHQQKLTDFNSNFSIDNLGTQASDNEIKSDICNKKYISNYPVVEDPHLDLKIHLGKYRVQIVCDQYYEDPHLEIWKKEVPYDDKYGTMYFLLTDREQVLEYFSHPLTYTAKGYRYGVE